MPNNLIKAQPPLEYIAPQFNYSVLTCAKIIHPWWLKFQTNIREIEAENVDILANLYQQFEQKKIRLLLAFRHPRTDDPFCLVDLFWRILPQEARKNNISLKKPTHIHFVYDRGIPLWAGSAVGWLYSSLGGSSIQRGKLDLQGLKAARNLLVNGNFPLAIAPEGATNGHNDIMSPLEPGVAQLSFWCLEDLQKAGRNEEVIILPMGIKYRYLDEPWQEIANILSELEIDCGLVNSYEEITINNNTITDKEIAQLYARLIKLAEYFLSEIEYFYERFYHQHLSKIEDENNLENNPNKMIALRLQKLLDTALKVAEDYFFLKPQGTLVDRCRRLEQAGWDYIYQKELKENDNISAVTQGLANHVAEEANARMWHMRIVESFVAVSGYYVKENPTVERFAETVMILWDLVARIKGENPFNRPKFGQQKVILTMDKPMLVKDYFNEYKKSRRQGVDNLTKDLQEALIKMI